MGNGSEWLTKIVIALIGLLIGGAPGYFLIGPNKPTRQEVSQMIAKEAPVSVYEKLNKIEIQQAEMRTDIKNILRKLESR